jgi:hypothetical protein
VSLTLLSIVTANNCGALPPQCSMLKLDQNVVLALCMSIIKCFLLSFWIFKMVQFKAWSCLIIQDQE